VALTERAKVRLRLLAALLRGRGHRLDMPRPKFYEEVQAIAAKLPASEREELKGLVDWVEDYERGAAAVLGKPDRSKKA
jgi:hypothetical protein